LVTARNITEARAGSAIQAVRRQPPAGAEDTGDGGSSAAVRARAVRTSLTQIPQQTAKTTKPIDQQAACVLPPQSGSMHSG
jgi:hypothetical protein